MYYKSHMRYFEYVTESSEAAVELQHPSRVSCAQCSEAFTSPWLLLRHAHDAHALPVCPSDELMTLPPVSSTRHRAADGIADAADTADHAATPPPTTRDDTAPPVQSDDVDVRPTSPQSDKLDWPGGASRTPDAQRASPLVRCLEKSRTPSPVESTRVPSREHKPQRYLWTNDYVCRLLHVRTVNLLAEY